MIVGIIIGVIFVALIGVSVMALLRIAKQTEISFGIEPSLEQEDRFVVAENAEEIEEVSE